MKQKIHLITGLVTLASAGLAFGCGCSLEGPRLQPVREVIVQQQTTCAMESTSSLDWGAPFRTVGHVISAPFVAIGSAFSPSDRYVEPVGEQLTTCPGYYQREYTRTRLMPVGERFTTVKVIREPMLQPVGERFTTVKVIRHEPILEPVSEQILWRKHHHHIKVIKPVGERFISEKRYHRTMLHPVSERFTTEKRYHKTIKPVGEKVILQKSSQKTMLKKEGQKSYWQGKQNPK